MHLVKISEINNKEIRNEINTPNYHAKQYAYKISVLWKNTQLCEEFEDNKNDDIGECIYKYSDNELLYIYNNVLYRTDGYKNKQVIVTNISPSYMNFFKHYDKIVIA